VRELPVDVRIVAATNRPLRELTEAGKFRADLFFRLSIIGVEAPPLREREGDIVLLAEHFLEQHARNYARPVQSLSPGARKRLCAHAWPGNVRELRNVLEQVVVFHEGGEIDGPAFPFVPLDQPTAAEAGFALPLAGVDLEQLERNLSLQALERTGWNMTHAGRLLGLSRDAMRYRVEKFQLRVDPEDSAGSP